MKKIVLVIFLSNLFCHSQVMWQFKKDTTVIWHYKNGDEFNGEKVDDGAWSYQYGWARSIYGNLEQQYYTDGTNHKIENGILHLSAEKKPILARTVDYMNDNDSIKKNKDFFWLNKHLFPYQAGMLQSKNKYLYGYFECRLKMPKEKGYWPAFWLYGGNPNEEIDILEGKSERPKKIHIDTHCSKKCDYVSTFLAKKSYGGWVKTNIDLTSDYNILACEWTPNFIKFYVNGQYIGMSTVSFKEPKHVVLNIAVPSDNGPFHPGPNKKDTTAVFDIDYVRVWGGAAPEEKGRSPRSGNGIHTTKVATEYNALSKKFKVSHKKLTFGPKSEGKKEGFSVSVFSDSGILQFTTLGNIGKEIPQVEIRNEKNELISTIPLDKSIINFNTEAYRQNNLNITVSHGKNRASSLVFVP
ncbi:MAG TPA: glycoside hydrolase family 16 protein [Bacteroidia bacterium]|nr:glycoside hydrolase family 16 protein [Bacteroidia bacterium]